MDRCLAELYLPRPFGTLTASEGQALMDALHVIADEFDKRENLDARCFWCFAPFREGDEAMNA